jgi:uncharacterized protein YecE (DUF72 family)
VILRVGTSGYAFPEWRGPFYPEDIADDAMLGFYAARFPTVEINNTFYRMPKEHVVAGWAAQVPSTFLFAVKASQRITHHARLKPECADSVAYLLRMTSGLEGKLGVILFQLPPNLKKDIDRLRRFLDLLPSGQRFTIEFRHESWFDDEVLDALRSREVALCVSEQEDFHSPVLATAPWGYLRLHRPDYDSEALREWAARVHAQPWTDAYVFFKHDHAAGSGPPAVGVFEQQLLAASR